MTAAPIKVRN